MKLHEIVNALLASGDGKPARAFEEPRAEGPDAFAARGIDASPELIDYATAAAELRFRKAVGSLLEESGTSWSICAVRPPRRLLFREMRESVVAFLCGAVPIGVDPDAGAYLVAGWGIGAKTSPVASFLFNDVSPADEEPGDFAWEAPSIRALLKTRGASERGGKSNAAANELARLYRRGIWLAQLVHKVDREDHDDPVDAIVLTARDASPMRVYTKEAKHFVSHPHWAAYWLLAHAMVGNAEALSDALERVEAIDNPVIVELRTTLKKKGRFEALLEKHRPELSSRDLESIRRRARAVG
ncbi:hypothetical protein [Pyxidicoccus caerfyrddinensis]|uniref:hypothetical protein n=2 Tax=Myxococcaceae TaxID=31 RepID=UPI0013DA6EDF|nr:hypothetical protein [Pyxidicoccus caerfyrddinensis]